jgi:hypothetical protein
VAVCAQRRLAANAERAPSGLGPWLRSVSPTPQQRYFGGNNRAEEVQGNNDYSSNTTEKKEKLIFMFTHQSE